MSPTPEPAPATLRSLIVDAKDAQSDILLLDSKGRLIQRGLGPAHTFTVESGIYRVKVVTGREVQERPVILIDEDVKRVEFNPLSFASPIPLEGTSTSHEYHMDAAARESAKVHVADGAGSSLFFFVRDWTPDTKEGSRRPSVTNPATGLSLYAVSAAGERKVADIALQGAFNLDADAWCACTVAVKPGVYDLRLTLPTGEVLHQAIAAAPSWQTQMFVFVRGYATGNEQGAMERRADLARSSILMSRAANFSQAEPDLRLTELARVALVTTRPAGEAVREHRLVPDEVRGLLERKCDNPMLGIYACHLLLLETEPDVALLTTAVANLRALIGMPHPDVEALALRADKLPEPAPFQDPPMLRRSWSLIVDANTDRPDLIADSLSARVSTDFWLQGPWLVWRTKAPDAAFDASSDRDLTDVEASLAQFLGLPRRARSMSHETTESAKDLPSPQVLSGLASSALQPISSLPGAGLGAGIPKIDPESLRRINKQLNLSQAQLSGVLQSLQKKLAKTDFGK